MAPFNFTAIGGNLAGTPALMVSVVVSADSQKPLSPPRTWLHSARGVVMSDAAERPATSPVSAALQLHQPAEIQCLMFESDSEFNSHCVQPTGGSTFSSDFNEQTVRGCR